MSAQANSSREQDRRISSLDREEFLLIYLSRPRRLFAQVADESRSIMGEGINHKRLLELAVEHAVFPLVYRNLKKISDVADPQLITDLGNYYRASHRNGLLLAHRLFDLNERLSEIGVDMIVHKGVVVASLYYGDLSDRVFGDLDLFVRKRDVRKAAALFESLEYQQVDPLPRQIEDWWTAYRPWQNPHGNAVGFAKHLGGEDQLDIDLQWGLAPHYFTLDLEPAPFWDRLRSVEIHGNSIGTFSEEDTFLLLCLHGAKHSWTELRQVVDIAAFLSAVPDLDWDSIMESAAAAHCKRIVLLAARLGAELQGAVLPDSIRRLANSSQVSDLFSRIVQWRFAERRSRFGRLSQSVAFHTRARDRKRDCIGTVIHDLQIAVQRRNRGDLN
ncbi:MAG: nucleotidyltransferase family protein [Rhodothermales bacterium]|nr:nucleotidyltransferase family protein [Rhodothermales bacterium]